MAGVDLTGYSVEAIDGWVRKVDEAAYEAGRSYIVVDTRAWIFGSKVLLPAGVVRSLDSEEEAIYVNRTKDEINAPEYDQDAFGDIGSREAFASHYAPGGSGDRDEP